MEHSDKLINDYEGIRLEPKLQRVMNSDQPCQFQLWILEIHQKKQISQRLLYSWVIPSTHNSGQWYKADVNKKWSPESKAYKAYIKKHTFYTSGKTVSNLMLKLLKRYSFKDACQQLDIATPKDALGEFSLLSYKDDAPQSFAIRPPIFLEASSLNNLYKPELRQQQSPSKYVSAVSASLVSYNKLNLLAEDLLVGQPLDEADQLAKLCLGALSTETGLAFKGTDSRRLGNIEWINFPSFSPESEPIDFCTIKQEVSVENDRRVMVKEHSSNKVDVYLKTGLDLPYEQLLVRCRLRNDNDIMLDQTRLVNLKDAESGLRFNGNQQISRVQFTVWIPTMQDNEWDLWIENDTPLVRQMGTAMGMVGLQGRVELSTLETVKNSEKVKNRIEKYENIKQTRYSHSTIGGYNLDPWVPAGRQVNDYVKQLFPPASKGKFFPKGWSENGPGVLTFAEWFKSLTTQTDNRRLTIVDPYFDTVGVELIAHTTTTNTSYEILTCTQSSSNDDSINEVNNNNVEPQRAGRIKQICSKYDRVLKQLRVDISDLRSTDGGKKSLFHDRYFLVYNENGQIIEGYHLSNSIQTATRLAPLLVTPIPSDILQDVAAFVNQIRNAQEPVVHDTKVVKLYSTQQNSKYSVVRNLVTFSNEKFMNKFNSTSVFFSGLLQDNMLKDKEIIEIKQTLIEKGLLSKDGSQFTVDDEEKMEQRLVAFSERLLLDNEKLFGVKWENFSFWLANIVGGENYLFQVCNIVGKSLVSRLKTYLLPPNQTNIEEIGSSQQCETEACVRYINQPFEEAVQDAYNFLDHHYNFRTYGQYHVIYAAKALLIINPKFLVEVLEGLKEHFQQHPLRRSNHIIITSLLAETLMHMMLNVNNELIQSLLQSKVASLRALGSQGRWISTKDKTPSIDELDLEERLLAYAEWMYHLRVKSNIRGKETSEVRGYRTKLFERMRNEWQPNLTMCKKRAIIKRLSGPSAGSWADDIYHDLLVPLVDDGHYTSDEAILIWVESLLDQAEELEGRITFYPPRDQELTVLCSRILTNLSQEAWGVIKKRLNKLISKMNQIIRNPFAKSQHFTLWNNTKVAGLWITILLELAKNSSNSHCADLQQLLNNLDDKLKTLENSNDIFGLFAEEVLGE